MYAKNDYLMIYKNIYLKFYLIVFCCSILNCRTLPGKKEKGEKRNDISNTKQYFFEQDKRKYEYFRVFITSEEYEITQLAGEDIIQVEEDIEGNKLFSKEIARYDKIDYMASPVLRVTLYEISGKISRIRILRSSGLSELDKLIGDDMTRWKFKYLNQDQTLNEFNIHYRIILQNKLTKEEVIEFLKQHSK